MHYTTGEIQQQRGQAGFDDIDTRPNIVVERDNVTVLMTKLECDARGALKLTKAIQGFCAMRQVLIDEARNIEIEDVYVDG